MLMALLDIIQVLTYERFKSLIFTSAQLNLDLFLNITTQMVMQV